MTDAERRMWALAFHIRGRYIQIETQEKYEKAMQEAAALYDKYKNTDAAIPARWCSMMIREIFNTEWKVKHGGEE